MTLKVGIDNYSYHRFFGEVYPGQQKPAKDMTTEDFLAKAKDFGVDGVSLESCFIKSFDPSYLAELKDALDGYGFDRVWAWGHPDGLEGGKNEVEFKAMVENLKYAAAIGANTMRVVGSSLAFRFEPHGPQLEKLTKMFKQAAKEAEAMGIKMAVENHFDFDSDEFLSLIEAVDSPNFGLTFDTGNFTRLLDEPVKAMQKLGKYVYATHIKDLKIQPNTMADEWYFFACTAIGDGILDFPGILKQLHEKDYSGLLAIELDYPHVSVAGEEDAAVRKSVQYLKDLVATF